MKGAGFKALLFYGLMAAFACYVFLLCLWSPFTADSFAHALNHADHGFSIRPVLEEYGRSYLYWNPRLGELLAFFTATAGKWFFCLVNPVVLLALAWMIFYMAAGRAPRVKSGRDILLLGVGALLLVTSTSRPGVTLYWLSGAANYAWGAAVWLAFLCLYRALWSGKNPIKDGYPAWLWVAVLGFLAGMTNENQVPATLGLLGVFFMVARWRKKSLPRWFFIGGAAFLAGGLCLLLAPGNAARMNTPGAGGAQVLNTWAERFDAIPGLLSAFHEFLSLPLCLLALAAVMLAVLWRWGRSLWSGECGKRLGASLLFIPVAYGMAISFFVRVQPAWHAMFSATLMLVIGVLGLYAALMESPERPKTPCAVLLVCACPCLYVCAGYLMVYPVIHEQVAARQAIVQEQIAAGQKHPVVPPYDEPRTSYCPVQGLPYISIMWRMCSPDPQDFINSNAARYYDVESIIVADKER